MTASSFLAIATLLVAETLTNSGIGAEAFAIFKSNDGGRSWKRSDAGMPGRSRINGFGSMDGVLFAGTNSGIFTSKDEALSWQPAEGGAMSSGRITSFATLGRRVFAGTDGNGLLVSADGGISWALEPTFPSLKVRCLLVHGGKVYVGTDSQGVFASDDTGQAWTRLSAGLPSQAQIFALSSVGGELFAGLYSRGLYGWDEPKRSWVKIGTVTPLALASVQDTLIAGHNPGGLHWSGDLGASWSKGVAGSHGAGTLGSLHSDDSGELTSEAPVWELGSDNGLVFAGASAGIHYSEDRGRTWTRARRGLPERSPGIAFLARRGFVLAAVHLEESKSEPNRAANGSEPISSETNRASSTAGSRR